MLARAGAAATAALTPPASPVAMRAMDDLRLQLQALPQPKRLYVTLGLIAAFAALGWWIAEWPGALAGGGFAASWILRRPKTQKVEFRDADVDRINADLARKRRDLIGMLQKPDPTPAEPALQHAEGEAEAAQPAIQAVAPERAYVPAPPPAPVREPVDLFPARPPERPIVEEGSRWFRRARRSGGSIVE